VDLRMLHLRVCDLQRVARSCAGAMTLRRVIPAAPLAGPVFHR